MAVYARTRKKRKKHGFRNFLIIAAMLGLLTYSLVNYIEEYPKEMIDLFISNPEARGFVLAYPSHIDDPDLGQIDASELSDSVPLFQQWDRRWGYFSYGSGVLGITGCGPTCLSMVIVGLTGNTDATPAAVADFSTQNGYYVAGVGTSWDLMTAGAQSYGLSSLEVGLSEEEMAAQLSSGHPIIASLGPGDFTTNGHFIVIKGYENGSFTVNDPNSKKRSGESWQYSVLAPQIRCLWSFSAA